jgi:hypothetical protein
MVYIFGCLRPSCIGKQGCVKAYRYVVDKTEMQMIDDEEYNRVMDMTDEQLLSKGMI